MKREKKEGAERKGEGRGAEDGTEAEDRRRGGKKGGRNENSSRVFGGKVEQYEKVRES